MGSLWRRESLSEGAPEKGWWVERHVDDVARDMHAFAGLLGVVYLDLDYFSQSKSGSE